MNSNVNLGAERPHLSSEAAPEDSVTPNVVSDHERSEPDRSQMGSHSPEAKALLRRYLSEIHGYRQLGNAALSELEKRLLALSNDELDDAKEIVSRPKAGLAAPTLMRAAAEEKEGGDAQSPNLTDRLKELSAYLHADLTKHQITAAAARPGRDARSRQPMPQLDQSAQQAPRSRDAHKPTPNAPILDRAWFEKRFAAMRASIDQLAEQVPAQRLDTLEDQFVQLMEKLEAKETGRPMAAVEAGLKKLAAYLEDNKQWSQTQDQRVRNIEDRLDQLSRLVAQSYAALSATAKGLEIVARGTGKHLARATADLVAEKLEPKLEDLNQKGAIKKLNGEVMRLSEQSKRLVQATDERLKQLQNSLDDSLDRMEDFQKPHAAPPAEEGWDTRVEKPYPQDRRSGKTMPAARQAAYLSEDLPRSVKEHGEPVRYQIPYGEFLPDEERASSRIGLVIAAIILLLASAAMLYLNLREKSNNPTLSSASVSQKTGSASEDTIFRSQKTILAETNVPRIQESMAPAPRIVSVKSQLIPAAEALSTIPPGTHNASAPEPVTQAVGSQEPAPLTLNGSTKADNLREAAIMGDVNAQFAIGEAYLLGRNIDGNLPAAERLSKAARWFRRAADKDHAAAQYRLATLYELGQGVPKDYVKAMDWYSRAAGHGHVKAMHNLAVLSIASRQADYQTGAKWFAKAAGHGLADSQYNLGVLYERGLGVPKDPAIAYRWFSLAANQGDEKAAQKRDALAASLSAEVVKAEDEKTLAWKAAAIDAAANGSAPQAPAGNPQRPDTAIEPKIASTQLLKGAWNAKITQLDTIVAEAQRLLKQLGYRPGPVDGIAGPKTLAAIRAFEQKTGLPGTGQITGALIAKMAFAISS